MRKSSIDINGLRLDEFKKIEFGISKITRYFLSKQSMSQKKLQKLAYYSVAWHYALFDKPFAGVDLPFEAWVHGPVSRNLYSKYKGYKFNNIPKIRTEPDFSKYKNDELEILEFVWENYGEFTANQLETLTHTETPWQKKRKGYGELESSSEIIDVDDMKKYYRKFIRNDGEIN